MKLQQKVYLLLVPFLLLSCTDILNVEPVSLIGAESFWNSEEDARAGIYGMYVLNRDQIAYNLLWWGEARGETLSFGLQAPEGRERYFENNLNPVNAGPNWRGLYWVVHQTNLGIKYIPDIEFADEKKNLLLAQAYAMRAHLYYNMVRIWGDVPLVLDPTEGVDPDEIFRSRTPVEEVFAQIKSDIEEALSLFPSENISDRSVWSVPSVNALKTDVYLWTGKRMAGGNSDIQEALAATEAVDQANVSLLENFGDIFDFNNKKNAEILLAAHFGRDESGANYGSELYIRGDQIPGATDDETRERVGEGGGFNRVSPSPLLRSQFDEEDLRRDATFIEIYTFDEDGSADLFASVSNKFSGMVEDGSRHFLDDLILYRYADILLMRAEAKNALGQNPTQELNMVRNRAGLDDYAGPMDQESLDSAILQERMFELAHEGKRWWDLVRFGKAFDLVPSLQDRTRDDCLLLWPISTETITLNSRIEQNPCYNN
ncbi:RagB/SusD family nutrient uptake outer membrane protein [soil metagenome]